MIKNISILILSIIIIISSFLICCILYKYYNKIFFLIYWLIGFVTGDIIRKLFIKGE